MSYIRFTGNNIEKCYSKAYSQQSALNTLKVIQQQIDSLSPTSLEKIQELYHAAEAVKRNFDNAVGPWGRCFKSEYINEVDTTFRNIAAIPALFRNAGTFWSLKKFLTPSKDAWSFYGWHNRFNFRRLDSDNLATVNKIDTHGYSAIHYAVQAKSQDAIKFLLEHKADLKVRTKGGDNAFDLAVKTGDIKFVKWLATECCNLDETTLQVLRAKAPQAQHAQILEEVTKAFQALRTNTPQAPSAKILGAEAAKALEAEVAKAFQGQCANAFQAALRQKRMIIAQEVLKLIPAEKKNEFLVPGLMIAAELGELSTVKWLIEDLSDVKTEQGLMTWMHGCLKALKLASGKKHTDVVNYLSEGLEEALEYFGKNAKISSLSHFLLSAKNLLGSENGLIKKLETAAHKRCKDLLQNLLVATDDPEKKKLQTEKNIESALQSILSFLPTGKTSLSLVLQEKDEDGVSLLKRAAMNDAITVEALRKLASHASAGKFINEDDSWVFNIQNKEKREFLIGNWSDDCTDRMYFIAKYGTAVQVQEYLTKASKNKLDAFKLAELSGRITGGRFNEAKKLIEADYPISLPKARHYSPLKSAIWKGNLEAATFILNELLKQLEVPSDYFNSTFFTADLSLAVRHNQLPILQELMKRGVDFNIDKGQIIHSTLLEEAVAAGHEPIVAYLLERSLNYLRSRPFSPSNQPVISALLKANKRALYAAQEQMKKNPEKRKNYQEIINRLNQATSQTKEYDCPNELFRAVRLMDPTVRSPDSTYSIGGKGSYSSCTAYDAAGFNVLERAIQAKRIKEVTQPERWKAYMNSKEGHSTIRVMIETGDVDILKKFNLDPACYQNLSQTPAYMSAKHGHLPMLTYFFDNNISNILDENLNREGETVLHAAMESGDGEMVQYIIKHVRAFEAKENKQFSADAWMKRRNREGKTAYQMAAEKFAVLRADDSQRDSYAAIMALLPQPIVARYAPVAASQYISAPFQETNALLVSMMTSGEPSAPWAEVLQMPLITPPSMGFESQSEVMGEQLEGAPLDDEMPEVGAAALFVSAEEPERSVAAKQQVPPSVAALLAAAPGVPNRSFKKQYIREDRPVVLA